MAEQASCDHEEDIEHLKGLQEKSCLLAEKMWEWMSLSDQRAFLYEYPELAAWIKDNLGIHEQ